jgi:hypothetical protein
MAGMNDIITEIRRKIDDMVSGADYNYTWTTVNTIDKAKNQNYPIACVLHSADTAIDGAGAAYGFTDAELIIEIVTKNQAFVSTPTTLSDIDLDKALRDIRKCFTKNVGDDILLDGNVHIKYISSERKYREDVVIPGSAITKWNVRYQSD